MKKTWISLLLVLSILWTCCACTGSQVSSGETRTVTDCMGRKVEIPQNPQSVACMYSSIAHIMAMLDAEEALSGTPKGVKSDTLMLMKFPQIAETATPYQEGAINVEELLRIDADLALIRYSTASNKGETEKLDKLGIPYLVIDYRSLDELKTAIRVMGTVFDREERAEAYIKFQEETVDLVAKRLQDIPKEEQPAVYHSVNEAIRTDAQGDICGEIMQQAAVRDISIEKGIKQAGSDKIYTTLEEIYKWDPDAFIANESSVTEYILSDMKWKGLTAVRQGKVYTLPVGATRWCHPGSIETHMAVLAIARIFYPQKFSDINMKAYTKDYYEEFFRLKLDDKTIEKILKGEGMHNSNAPVR
ncbi:MAG: ABC transporter substrate-binding protein [Firmicutes bacterium]|nr:ABC transporter substrate-binding protein [Bacillota bacterium]